MRKTSSDVVQLNLRVSRKLRNELAVVARKQKTIFDQPQHLGRCRARAGGEPIGRADVLRHILGALRDRDDKIASLDRRLTTLGRRARRKVEG
jgi:hypothetical protein